MSVRTLNEAERKKSLSGQKKKNTKGKNVLNRPSKFEPKNMELDTQDFVQLSTALLIALPCAALGPDEPMERPRDRKDKGKGCYRQLYEGPLTENKLKRRQLAFGVNGVSRALLKGSISCVFISTDVYPKLMVNHLKMLCNSKNVPYVTVPKFRKITKVSLGFSCVALGIKKFSTDFAGVVKALTSIVEKNASSTSKDGCTCNDIERRMRYRDVEMEEDNKIKKDHRSKKSIQMKKNIGSAKSVEMRKSIQIKKEYENRKSVGGHQRKPFAYVYRAAGSSKRAFLPDPHGKIAKPVNEMLEFIPLTVVHEQKVETGQGSCEQNADENYKTEPAKDSNLGSATKSSTEYSQSKLTFIGPNPKRNAI